MINHLAMRKITIILKPTDECNFRCQYCYHADTNYKRGRMTIDLFEEIIKKATSSYDNIVLIFHGGEPLLMGYDFFERALQIINKYKKDWITFSLGIQTNGYLLNDKFCKLFKDNGILPAVSFDGPGHLNSLREKTDEVTNKISKIRCLGYSINLLGVITKRNINELETYYEFAKNIGCNLKLNPVFKSGGATSDNDYMLGADEYVSSLEKLIPTWMKDNPVNMNFEPLTTLTYMALTRRGKGCSSCGCLTKWISVHYDGTLYPCGRSYPMEYSLGNIRDIENLSLAFTHENFNKLLKGAIQRRNICHENCDYFSICQGGCNNDALLNGDVSTPDGFMCYVYKNIIPFIQNYIDENILEIKNTYVLELHKRIYDGQHSN